MMMGFGSNGNGGGGSSSSSSNLSALAQPFTVDRSVSKPLVDLTEPPLNWLNTHSLTTFDSSNAYAYPFNSHTCDSIKTSNFVEAQPYYPSYISPTKFTYDDYTQTLSGLWGGSRDWTYGKNEMNVSDLPIYKDRTDQAAQLSKVLNTCEEKSHILACEKPLGSGNTERFDYKSFPGQNTEFIPVEHSTKSFVGSTSVFPENYSLVLSSEQVRSRNLQMPYSGSHEKGVKQPGISPNDITSVRKSSPGLVIRSAVGSVSSAPNTSSLNNVEIGSVADNMEFAAKSNFSHAKDFHTVQSSEGNVRFDSSKVGFHLEGDNYSFSELPLETNENLLSNISVTKDLFRENSGLQVPHISQGGLTLTLDVNESINCFGNSSESLDHYNPAVDSPCWKGAPVSHCSPLETSGPVLPQLTKTIEACSSSILIGPTNNGVKFSSKKPSEFSLYQGYGCPENDLTPSPERLSVANMLFRELGSHDDVKEGSYLSKSSYGNGFQLSDAIEKPRKEYALSKKSIYDLNFKPFHSMQQTLEEGKLTTEKKCESRVGVADVGMIISDSSEGCSSHVPFHATEHVLSSPPPSVEAAPSKLTKLHGEELAPKICVQMLINTMHNLSELLLFHCSNEACELKKQELSALKNVVNNLDKCILKNLGSVVPSQESLFPEKTSQFLRKLPELHEGVTVSRPHVTKAAAVTDLNQPDYLLAQKERKHSIPSNKFNEQCCDFASVRGDANRLKDDNMTQAIKKVLGENFSEEEGTQPQILLYKNLWLEAEAALCSVNYRARFNRMKIEMQKCKSLEVKDLSKIATVGPDLSKYNAEVEKLSCSTFSNISMANKLIPEVNKGSTQDISVPECPIITTSHPDDVMARFHILKRQLDSANCISTTDAEKLSSSNFFHDVNKFDEMASEAKDDQTPSPASFPDDVEASVMARFRTLKNRADNSISTNMDGDLVPQAVNLGFSGVKNHWPAEDEILEATMEPELQLNPANHIEGRLSMKEFHLLVDDDHVIHNHRLGNQLPAACYDSSSSDWEHVLKDELPGQNS